MNSLESSPLGLKASGLDFRVLLFMPLRLKVGFRGQAFRQLRALTSCRFTSSRIE